MSMFAEIGFAPVADRDKSEQLRREQERRERVTVEITKAQAERIISRWQQRHSL
jgi:hypothetical protein